jgi:hypothetical protein
MSHGMISLGRGAFPGSRISLTCGEDGTSGQVHVLGHATQIGHLIESLEMVQPGSCLLTLLEHGSPLIVPEDLLSASCTRGLVVLDSRLERWLDTIGLPKHDSKYIQNMRIPRIGQTGLQV